MLSQIRWRQSVKNFQSPKILNWTPLRLGHFKASMIWSSKPFHWSSGCMFRVIVLLEDEPPPQPQVFCRLHHIFFIQYCSVLGSSTLPPIRTSLPVPAEEKHPTAWCFHHHHSSLLGSGWWPVLGFHHTAFLHWGQKVLFWSHLPRAPSSTC